MPISGRLFRGARKAWKPQYSCVLERIPVAQGRPQDSSEGPYQKGGQKGKKNTGGTGVFLRENRGFRSFSGALKLAFALKHLAEEIHLLPEQRILVDQGFYPPAGMQHGGVIAAAETPPDFR
jgi:hypothetical protein